MLHGVDAYNDVMGWELDSPDDWSEEDWEIYEARQRRIKAYVKGKNAGLD